MLRESSGTQAVLLRCKLCCSPQKLARSGMSVPPPSHPLFSASRTALHSLARWASAPTSPFAVQDGLFGAAHSSAVERELAQLFADGHYTRTADKTFFGMDNLARLERRVGDSARAERGDATLYVDASAIERHAAVRELVNVRKVARFMDSLRERLGMRRTILMFTCYPAGGARFTRHFDSCALNARGSLW